MNQHTIDIFKKVFKEVLENEHNNSSNYSIVVKVTNDWEYELPESVKSNDYIRLELTGWALEQTYITDEGIHVTLAFGEDENSRLFKFNEIIQITDDKAHTIISNYLYSESINVEPETKTNYTLKDVMHKDTKGLKHSTSKLSLVTPKKQKPKDK